MLVEKDPILSPFVNSLRFAILSSSFSLLNVDYSSTGTRYILLPPFFYLVMAARRHLCLCRYNRLGRCLAFGP